MQSWGENKMTTSISTDYVSFEYIAFREVTKIRVFPVNKSLTGSYIFSKKPKLTGKKFTALFQVYLKFVDLICLQIIVLHWNTIDCRKALDKR